MSILVQLNIFTGFQPALFGEAASFYILVAMVITSKWLIPKPPEEKVG